MKKLLLILALLCSPLWASIARDGSCSAAATSCTFSATATGDLKVVFAYDTSSTIPTLPSGWTSITSGAQSGGGVKTAFRLGCNVSSSSSDTGSGTWTSASGVVGMSYSGTNVGTTANCNTTGIGAFTSSSAKGSTSASYGTITLQKTDGSSWVLGDMGGSASSTCTPSGMTNVSATGTVLGSDTNAGVTSWPTTTCTVSSESWWTAVAEILAATTAKITLANSGSVDCPAGATTCAITYSPTAGNELIVGILAGPSNPTVNSVTDNGTGGGCTYTSDYSFTNIVTHYTLADFRCPSAVSSTTTITATFSVGSNAVLIVAEFSGASGNLDVAVSGTNTGTSTTPSANSLTTTVADDVVVGFGFCESSACAWSTNGSWTLVRSQSESANGNTAGMVFQAVSGTGAFTATGTISSSQTWFMAAAAYSPFSSFTPVGSKERKLEQLGENL